LGVSNGNARHTGRVAAAASHVWRRYDVIGPDPDGWYPSARIRGPACMAAHVTGGGHDPYRTGCDRVLGHAGRRRGADRSGNGGHVQ
jgi:hypothetical protein